MLIVLLASLISGPGSVGASLAECPNVQNEVYMWRVLEKVGCIMYPKVLGRPSLSRREVELPRRDVKLSSPCNVATWISHVATSF